MKKFYARTNKHTRFVVQIAKLHRRQAFFAARRRERERDGVKRAARAEHPVKARQPLRQAISRYEPRNPPDPALHHQISVDTRDAVNIYAFLAENADDPACEVRLSRLFILG